MDSILQQITDWIKEMLVSGVMDNLNNIFDAVNGQVGEIATEVGTTPQNFSPAIFNMIRNLVGKRNHADCGNYSYLYCLL